MLKKSFNGDGKFKNGKSFLKMAILYYIKKLSKMIAVIKGAVCFAGAISENDHTSE